MQFKPQKRLKKVKVKFKPQKRLKKVKVKFKPQKRLKKVKFKPELRASAVASLSVAGSAVPPPTPPRDYASSGVTRTTISLPYRYRHSSSWNSSRVLPPQSGLSDLVLFPAVPLVCSRTRLPHRDELFTKKRRPTARSLPTPRPSLRLLHAGREAEVSVLKTPQRSEKLLLGIT